MDIKKALREQTRMRIRDWSKDNSVTTTRGQAILVNYAIGRLPKLETHETEQEAIIESLKREVNTTLSSIEALQAKKDIKMTKKSLENIKSHTEAIIKELK